MQGADRTLASLLHGRAESCSDERLYTFLDFRGEEERTLTFAQLYTRAASLGSQLAEKAGPRERALVLTLDNYRFVEAFAACQCAGVIAVPAYPPLSDAAPQLETLRTIVADSRPRVALTDLPPEAVDRLCTSAPELAQLTWMPAESTCAAAPPRRSVAADDVSFLQYTSGSTSVPKGVAVTHGALIRHEEMIKAAFGFSATDVVVGWLPLFHDMGLIGNLLQPLYSSAHAVLMPPLAFLQRPGRWLEAIDSYQASVAGGPNFSYELCVRRTTQEEREALRLDTWRLAFNGAEPIRASTMEAFSRTFGGCGFKESAWYPCYGLAEATLLATGSVPGEGAVKISVRSSDLEEGRIVDGGDRILVSSGIGWLDRRVAIVDPDTEEPASPGRVGEIWLSGDDLARGYWGREEASERTFRARLAKTNEGPFLRTGDLGVLCDGRLFVTGRRKDLIVVAGRNLYPSDLEATVQDCDPLLRPGCCAAFAVDGDETEAVVVVAEIKDEAAEAPDELRRLRQLVRRAVARGHGVDLHDVVLLRPHSVPKTSSGKVRRRACRAAYERRELRAVAPPSIASAVR